MKQDKQDAIAEAINSMKGLECNIYGAVQEGSTVEFCINCKVAMLPSVTSMKFLFVRDDVMQVELFDAKCQVIVTAFNVPMPTDIEYSVTIPAFIDLLLKECANAFANGELTSADFVVNEDSRPS